MDLVEKRMGKIVCDLVLLLDANMLNNILRLHLFVFVEMYVLKNLSIVQ